jgi:selenocysteine lyase/cysteine desulfurase
MPDFSSAFPDFAPTVYLNCAYQGPFPLAAAARVSDAVELKFHPDRMKPSEYFDLPDRVRGHLARVVGAGADQIALTNSATQGIGFVASGLQFAPGDEVVVAATNFPSNLFTWLHLRRRDVRVRVLEPEGGVVRPEQVAGAVNPRTRVVALDWVDYSNGARIDLAAIGDIVRRQDALFVVDGTQGAGAIELDLHSLPVDVLVVAAYKWLLGPYGTGFAYVGPRARGKIELGVINWLAVAGADDFDSLPAEEFELLPSAKVFDVPATANYLNLMPFEASLEFVRRATVRSVNEHCTRLLNRMAEGLKSRGYSLSTAADPEHRSTILSFRAGSPEKTARLAAKLKANHIEVSVRRGMIRVSPYLYNSQEQIDLLLENAD